MPKPGCHQRRQQQPGGRQWQIDPPGHGYYRLTTQWQEPGKSLDIINDGKKQHTPVVVMRLGTYGRSSLVLMFPLNAGKRQPILFELQVKRSYALASNMFLDRGFYPRRVFYIS